MGVVDVDGVLFCKVFQCAVQLHVAAHDVRDGGSHQEVLLAQTQVFACRMVVIRIEDFADCLGGGVLTKGFDVVAAVEGIHVDGRALCAPYTQDADALAVIAGDHNIIRNCLNSGIVLVQDVVIPIVPKFFDVSAKVDIDCVLRDALQPDFAAGQPLVRQLGLPAVDNLLFEDTKFIQNRITHGRVAAGCQCIHKAGSQSAQTAVAQTGIRLQFEQVFHPNPHLFERLRKFTGKIEVVDAVFQRPSQ